ncbi:MAG: glutamine--tRNA ligase/YqeY domain fusion protein [Myxococcaceae bacterium]|nr:MAG: glutamine--tRNA ligase/YqeY domain fusion protein [Myxococcaceae bacterium]
MSDPEHTKGTAPRTDDGPGNFVDDLVRDDLAAGLNGGRLMTRFPPEPNGYLHLGHAKSITLNFGLAQRHGGVCNLRFDDTNPATEEVEYVESIKADVRWLGYEFGERLYFASDYFEQLYTWAEKLIGEGRAYVDSQDLEAIRAGRGDFHRPGVNSPFRDRSAAENLDLFRRMRAGEFPDGAHVLRAKIDMASKDLNLRDPLMYRIRHATHHRTGDRWCIYPMYDWAHGESDAIEGVTHSICTLEFINHRGLYEWFLEAIGVEQRPKQIEFGKLNLSYTVLSKRRMKELVEGGHVSGWDDPRMPTLAAVRRRGFTPEALRAFCERVGVSKRDGVADVTLLEHAVREDLNARSPRVMGVLRPLKVIIENLPEGEVIWFDAAVHPEHPELGTRKVPFARELFIEREDFMEDPPKKFFRLSVGREVRLRYACFITCTGVEKDPATGEVTALRCTWDPATKGGDSPDGRKVKGTLHWVSAAHAVDAEVRLYDRLFKVEDPMEVPEGGSWKDHLNTDSLTVLKGCKLEPSLSGAAPGERFQFERMGYFCVDTRDSSAGALVFNRTIGLADSWAKMLAANKVG